MVIFTSKEAIVLDTNKVDVSQHLLREVIPRSQNGLYMFTERKRNDENISVNISQVEIDLWHKRLVHINENTLKNAHMSTNDIPKVMGTLSTCKYCISGRQTRKAFKSKFLFATFAGEAIHSDLSGPVSASSNRAKYLCTFLDKYSRYLTIASLVKKSDTAEAFEEFKISYVTKWFPKGVVEIHSDGGEEYQPVNAKNNIHSTSAPYTPEHNAFAERVNRTIWDPARTVLIESGLPFRYWDEAANHVTFVKNRTWHSSTDSTPYEKLTGKKTTMKHIRVSGCAAFVFDEKPRSKLSQRGQPGIYFSSDDYGKHRILLLKEDKIGHSGNVKYYEKSFPAREWDESSTENSYDSEDDDVTYEFSDLYHSDD